MTRNLLLSVLPCRPYFLGTLLLGLLITPMAIAQGSRYDNFTWTASPLTPGQSTNIMTVPRAAIHVCSYPANATPCTNYASIYSDKTLSTTITQPGFAADDYGNFGFYALAACYEYTVTVNGLSSGPYPICLGLSDSADASLRSLNGIRFADQFANVEAAGADCGVNKCTVIIPSTYAGTDCATTLRANVTYIDYRGSVLCLNNATTYNYTTVGNTHTMIRHQMRVTGVLPSGGGTAALYPITEAYNVTGNGTQTLDGSAQETQITGTLTGSIGNATGAEVDTYILSNGGTVNLATGIQAYVLSGTGTTTAVSEVRAVDALGYTGTGAAPNRIYSLYGRVNTSGSSRNYSLGIEGLGLLKYASNGYAASGLDAEDNAGASHRFLYVASDNTTNVQAVTRYLNLNGSDNITQLQVDGTANGVSVTGTLGITGVTTATGGLKVGASGSTISDTRELVQSSHACGSTSTCANTANQSAREIWGTITLSTGAATLTGITAYTATSSFVCMCTDQTSAAACKAVPASTTSVTFAGTGSDVLAYRCVGN